MDKFNSFAKAKEEISNLEGKKTIEAKRDIPIKRKERKEQVSIMLTPSIKEKARLAAERANMSVSELIGYLIEQHI